MVQSSCVILHFIIHISLYRFLNSSVARFLYRVRKSMREVNYQACRSGLHLIPYVRTDSHIFSLRDGHSQEYMLHKTHVMLPMKVSISKVSFSFICFPSHVSFSLWPSRPTSSASKRKSWSPNKTGRSKSRKVALSSASILKKIGNPWIAKPSCSVTRCFIRLFRRCLGIVSSILWASVHKWGAFCEE